MLSCTLIVDETADEKSSSDCAGAARQYSGTVGGIAMCQVAVTLTCASPAGHALIGRALYLPADWAADEERRELAGVPDEVMFSTKPQLAGDLLQHAADRGIRAGFTVGDEVYGGLEVRKSIRERGTGYVMAVRSNCQVTLPSRCRLTVKEASFLVKPGMWQRMRTGSATKGAVAALISESDPAHATRLLDDALHPRTTGMQQPNPDQVFVNLITQMPLELPIIVSRIDRVPAGQLVEGLERTARTLKEELEQGNALRWIARLAASADPARGQAIAQNISESNMRDQALAWVAIVTARTDAGQAEQTARMITDRGRSFSLGGKWRRRSAEFIGTREDIARYWSAWALGQIAVITAGGNPVDAWHLVDSIQPDATTTSTWQRPTQSGAPWHHATPDPAHAARLITDAEQIATTITDATEWRPRALAELAAAAAIIQPAHANHRLAAAEQIARSITSENIRINVLVDVTLAAAGIDPPLAEKIARSIPDFPVMSGYPLMPVMTTLTSEAAVAMSRIDPLRAERMALGIPDPYLRALTTAETIVRTDPAKASQQLEVALTAALTPGHVARAATQMALTDPDRAESIARTIAEEPSDYQPLSSLTRSDAYWRVRALADIATIYKQAT